MKGTSMSYRNLIIDRKHAERIWDKAARDAFTPAQLRPIDVDGYLFHSLWLPRDEEFVPNVYLDLGLLFLLWIRLAAYRYRFVLVPVDGISQETRWQIRESDIVSWLNWSAQMKHVVTFSTLKSGASLPLGVHAQSFPLENGGVCFSALREARTSDIVSYGEMPHFERIRIARLLNYPIKGLKITGDGSDSGRCQVAKKVFEFALNYDALKAFNLVFLPLGNETEAFFFPRRRDGRAVFGPDRWQIAALEVNGLMQAKTQKEAESLGPEEIRRIFRATSPSDEEFGCFLELINTF